MDEVLTANQEYVRAFGAKGELALPPARGFAVLTCMDARLDPAKYAGLSEGDAHVIRNAGGRASDDAIRSLVISYKLLGTSEWFVVHHSDCGMEFFTNELMGDLLAQSLETAELGADGFKDIGVGPGSDVGKDDRLAYDLRPRTERRRRRHQDQKPPARPGAYPDLRLRLRRTNRPADRQSQMQPPPAAQHDPALRRTASRPDRLGTRVSATLERS